MKNDLEFLANNEPSKSALMFITENARMLINIRKDIALMEEQLERMKKDEKVFSQETIPSSLLEYGLTSITLETGEKITIVEEVYSSLAKDPIIRRRVLKWIVKNGGAAIIKKLCTVEEPEKVLIDFLNEKDIPYDSTQDIHHSTLRAWWRSKLGITKGSLQEIEVGDIPEEASVFIYKKTKIK